MLGLTEEDKNLKSLGVPMLTGFMIKKGRLFPTWHRRYFELYSKKLIYYSDENKLSLKGIFKLQPDMMCKDSLTRNFCFCLFQPGNDKRNEILYLATYTMEEKENWMGKQKVFCKVFFFFFFINLHVNRNHYCCYILTSCKHKIEIIINSIREYQCLVGS